jgi:hypothetical protein
MARRCCAIVSDDHILERRLAEMKTTFLLLSYPEYLIDNGIQNAKSLDKTILRRPKEKCDNKNVLPFVHTFNPWHPNVHNVIVNNLPILKSSNRMALVMNKYTLIKSTRQPPNLKKLLTRAKFVVSSNIKIPCVQKCLSKHNCGTCSVLIEGATFDFGGKIFNVKYDMTCNVQNVIYVLVCQGCNKFYIGETGDSLRNRVTTHKEQIKIANYRKLHVSRHIFECTRNIADGRKFKIMPFYKVANNQSATFRKLKEEMFIRLFRPDLNVT